MPFVITVAQQKGGAGKTMLAANLAAAWAQTRRVAIIDIDPQGSLARWHGLRLGNATLRPIKLTDVSGWRLASELDRARRDYEVVLVDSPPQIDSDARRAIRSADLVLVPLQPSMPDLWAAQGTLRLAAEERRAVAMLLNRAPAASRLRTAIEAEITQRGVTLLAVALGNRTGFAQAFARGMGVTEAAPKSVAAEELRAVLAALEGLVA